MKIFAGYLIFINICALVIYGIDKYRAKRKKWRISERFLLLIALVGGSVGALCGIFLFRHKTRKWRFTIGVPCILLLQLLIAGFIFFHVKAKRESPSAVVSRQLEAMHDPSEEIIRHFISYETPEGFSSDDAALNETVTEAIRAFFRDYDYRIEAENISIDQKSAVVTAQITCLDTRALARDLCLYLTTLSARIDSAGVQPMSTEDYFSLLRRMILENSYKPKSSTVRFHLTKAGGAWQIETDERLQDELVGGFSTCINDPYLLEPQEVLTIYLDEFARLSVDDWLWYLETKDIFATGSPTYADQLDALYMQKITDHFSYTLDSCSVNGDTASARVTITSIDMNAVLALYRQKLLDYADSTESLTDNTDALADAAALYLIESLQETDQTTQIEVSVPLVNDGRTWQPQITDDLTNAFLGDLKSAIAVFHEA